MAVPAAVAGGEDLAVVPARTGSVVRERRLLVEGAAAAGPERWPSQPTHRGHGQCSRRAQVVVFHGALLTRGVLAALQRSGLRRHQTDLRSRWAVARSLPQVRASGLRGVGCGG